MAITNQPDLDQTNHALVGKAAFEFLQASQKFGLAAAATEAFKDQGMPLLSSRAMLAATLMAAAVDEIHVNDVDQIKKAIGEFTNGSDVRPAV